MQLGNFTGIPGLVVPIGYSTAGLPIGFQVSSGYCECWVTKSTAGSALNPFNQVLGASTIEELPDTIKEFLTSG